MATREQAEKIVDELAAKQAASDPAAVRKLDQQFAGKLERLANDDKAPPEMLERLQAMWTMFQADDERIGGREKALIMAALAYFVSPVDMIPDIAGKLGYLDDKMVVNIIWSRLGDVTGSYSKS